jgi:hypothetical protein
VAECQGADFSAVERQMAQRLRDHADYHWPDATGIGAIRRGVFLSRGGHAPRETCDWTGKLPQEDPE